MEKETLIGEITHYFTAIGVAIVKAKKNFKKGVRIHIKGATTDFYQDIYSMQLNHKDISKASKGQQIGMKVDQRVREGDKIYLVEKIKEKKSKKVAKTSKTKKARKVKKTKETKKKGKEKKKKVKETKKKGKKSLKKLSRKIKKKTKKSKKVSKKK
ncbi:hypothetical protein J7J41_00105 [bacterium]|nr:hypothetical protein [bacterium]